MPTSLGARRLITALLLLLALAAVAQGEDQTYDYATGVRVTRMWVPDGLAVARGILIWGNPWGGDGRSYIENEAARGFARYFEFVFIATGYWERFEGDEIDLWDQHLAALAEMSGHPEIVNAPWAPLGFSNGGQMSYGLNALRPQMVLGFVANKGGYYNDPLPPEPSLKTPGILVAGQRDTEFRRGVIKALFDNNRARGALWAWVEEQGMAHEGHAERLFLPFLAECIRLRYPPGEVPTATSGVDLIALQEQDGWLADQRTWGKHLALIAPHAVYPGDPALAGWLPSEAVARFYQAFATRSDWIVVNPPGEVADRPLYIETPAFHQYWTDPPTHAPALQAVRIDTREYPRWTKVQFLCDGGVLEEVPGDGSPQVSVATFLELEPGVHGLSVLVTDLDGTVRTSDLRHVVVLCPVVPAGRGWGNALLVLGLSAVLLAARNPGRFAGRRRRFRGPRPGTLPAHDRQ